LGASFRGDEGREWVHVGFDGEFREGEHNAGENINDNLMEVLAVGDIQDPRYVWPRCGDIGPVG
jgi:hypothetical protein